MAAIFGTADLSERVNKETWYIGIGWYNSRAQYTRTIHTWRCCRFARVRATVIVTFGSVMGDNGISVNQTTQA